MTSIDGGPIKEGGDCIDLLSLISAAVGGGPGEVQTLLAKLCIEWITVRNCDRETTTNVSRIYQNIFEQI